VRLPQLSMDAPRPVVSSDWTKTRPIRDASSASASTRRDGHAAATCSSRRDWHPSTLHDRMLCLPRLDQPKGHGRLIGLRRDEVAAFFKVSHSSRRRALSRRKRRSSSLVAGQPLALIRVSICFWPSPFT
jgi:hypothetical protein